MRTKLSKAAVAALTAPDPSGKQRLYWDTELRGFGVVVSGKSATRSFVAQREVNGRTRRVTLTTLAEMEASKRSVEDVRGDAAKMLVAMRDGADPRQRVGNVTLKVALENYLAGNTNLAERSRRGYRKTIERRYKKWLDLPLGGISAEMIETRFRQIKKEAGKRRTKNGLFVSEPGSASANGALRALRAVWKYARATTSPDLPPWPTERFRKQWFDVGRRERHVSADDLPAFYEAVNALDEDGNYWLGRDNRDYVLLLLYTGLRRGEAAGLKWADIDFAAKVLRLPATATKSKRRLDLPMSDLVNDLMVARRAVGTEGEFVFPGPGKSGHLEEPKKAFARLSKRCGLEVNPHAMRATYLTIASDVPMSAYQLKGLVNHSVGADVTGGYIHLTVENLRQPAQLVADKLKEHCRIVTPSGNVERLN